MKHTLKDGSQLHITEKHGGKMSGMQSISTNVLTNKRCNIRRKIPGSICEHCYAARQLHYRTNNAAAYENNGNILSSRILDDDEIPYLNSRIFRIEAFGDTINTVHAVNYLKMVLKNKNTFFGWWTKNVDYLESAINFLGLTPDNMPDNVNIIVSSVRVGETMDISKLWYVDKVFTVHDNADRPINCGTKKCIECRLCYSKNAVEYIDELIK